MHAVPVKRVSRCDVPVSSSPGLKVPSSPVSLFSKQSGLNLSSGLKPNFVQIDSHSRKDILRREKVLKTLDRSRMEPLCERQVT